MPVRGMASIIKPSSKINDEDEDDDEEDELDDIEDDSNWSSSRIIMFGYRKIVWQALS